MSEKKYIYRPGRRVPWSAKSVEIPYGITEIPDEAFIDRGNLRSVVIPGSVAKIGSNAFRYCDRLQSVSIPDSVTEINHCAFYHCSGLRSVTIPDSVTEIGDYAFKKCSGLREVSISGGITEIEESVFEGCSGLQSITIPDGVTKIRNRAFRGCSGLRSVTIPDSVTKIGCEVFKDCSGLQSVTVPDSVTEIGLNVFDGCTGLQSVTLPNGIKRISGGLFYGCTGLQSVTIPESVTYIGTWAFKRCSGLRSVTLPEAVAGIEKDVFEKCDNLCSVMFMGVDIIDFIKADEKDVNILDIIRALAGKGVPPDRGIIRRSIEKAKRGEFDRWIAEYPASGPVTEKDVDGEIREDLRRRFAGQDKTGHHVPQILDLLAETVRLCRIPAELLTETFDVKYTKYLLQNRIPIVPAEACRCYYGAGKCMTLIGKGRIFAMAEAIRLYNTAADKEPYRHLMDFIATYTDTKIGDIWYAVDHAEQIPITAETLPAQVRRHRDYAGITEIEKKYRQYLPNFKLAGHPCCLKWTSVIRYGLKAEMPDLLNEKNIGFLAGPEGYGQCIGTAEGTVMMHGFLNPNAGFWIVRNRDGAIQARAVVWEADTDTLVFDNLQFAEKDTCTFDTWKDREDPLVGVIKAWAEESGYRNIIVGGWDRRRRSKRRRGPELRLTPEEVFVLQDSRFTGVSFRDICEAEQHMKTARYEPRDYVRTNTYYGCFYLKKNGRVSRSLTHFFPLVWEGEDGWYKA